MFLPLTWVIVLTILGVLGKPYSRRCRIAAVALLLFFTNPFFLNLAMRSWEIPGRAIHNITEPYDVAIVLGGSMRYYNGELERPVYSSSVDRLIQAISLYRKGKVKKILLTGGSGRISAPDEKESAILFGVLKDAGIPAADIILENESRNTYQNAVETARILKSGSHGTRFLLITSAFHMRRSLACFSKAGINADPWSVDQKSGAITYTPDRLLVPEAAVMEYWDILFHEWVGVIVYKAAGYC